MQYSQGDAKGTGDFQIEADIARSYRFEARLRANLVLFLLLLLPLRAVG
jgi:hypothetical protein